MFLLLEWDNPLSFMWKGERKAQYVPWCRMRLLQSSAGTPAEGCPQREQGDRDTCISWTREPGFTGSLNMPLPIKNNTELLKHLKERRGRTNTAQAPCETEDCCDDAKLHCHRALTSKHLSYGGSLRSYLMLLLPNVQCCLGILMCWLCAALYYVDITFLFPLLDVFSLPSLACFMLLQI